MASVLGLLAHCWDFYRVGTTSLGTNYTAPYYYSLIAAEKPCPREQYCSRSAFADEGRRKIVASPTEVSVRDLVVFRSSFLEQVLSHHFLEWRDMFFVWWRVEYLLNITIL